MTKRLTPPRRRAAFILLAMALGSLLATGLGVGGARLHSWREARAREAAEAEAKEKQTRVLVVGDSFLDRWPMKRHLAADLQTWARGRDVGMWIRGTRGAGPADYRGATNQAITGGFIPQLLVIFFYVGNDISDSLRVEASDLPHYLKLAPQGKPERSLPPPAWPRRKDWVPFLLPGLSCSRGMERWSGGHEDFDWKGMRDRGATPKIIAMARSFVDRPRVGDDVVSPSLLMVAVHNPGVFRQNILVQGEGVRRAWLMTRAQLRLMFDYVRLYETDIALVIIPSVLQVSRSHDAFLKDAGFWLDDEMYSSTKPQRMLAALARKEKVAVLDLLPLLRAQPNPGKLYFKHDNHFNELGNQVVHDLVKKKLLEQWLKHHGSKR